MIIDEEKKETSTGVFYIRTHKGEKFPFEYAHPEIFYSFSWVLNNGNFGTCHFLSYGEALRCQHQNTEK